MSVKCSAIQSIKPGVEIVKVDFTATPAAGSLTTATAQPLGKAYSSIECVGIACQAASGLAQATYLPVSSSSVNFKYQNSVAEATTIRAIFECKV